jgi:cytochrome c oxidase subunit 2
MNLVTMATAFAGVSTAALAAEPGFNNWQLGFQASTSDVMDDITWFNNFTLIIITVITVFVLALLMYCAVKFSAKNNPVPSRIAQHDDRDRLDRCADPDPGHDRHSRLSVCSTSSSRSRNTT